MAESAIEQYYAYPRDDVARLVPAGTRRLLDVGCGAGGLGRSLRRRAPEIELVGVELNAGAAAKAREVYDQVLEGDIERGGALNLVLPVSIGRATFLRRLHELPQPVVRRAISWLAERQPELPQVPVHCRAA